MFTGEDPEIIVFWGEGPGGGGEGGPSLNDVLVILYLLFPRELNFSKREG